jgi:hypothetical protein
MLSRKSYLRNEMLINTRYVDLGHSTDLGLVRILYDREWSVKITRDYNSAYPCMVPGIDARKDPGEALNMDGIPKYKIVEEVGLEMIVRFTWTKGMSCVYNRTIVRGQPLEREKVGSIIRGLCDG